MKPATIAFAAAIIGVGFGALLTWTYKGTTTSATMHVSPHYSVEYTGNITLITDNRADKLYVYSNSEDSSALLQVLDLSQSGQLELKATKAK